MLTTEIRNAYIVPSMFLGHMLHAITNIGIMLISPREVAKESAATQNQKSLIPNMRFIRFTKAIDRRLNNIDKIVVPHMIFLNETDFR